VVVLFFLLKLALNIFIFCLICLSLLLLVDYLLLFNLFFKNLFMCASSSHCSTGTIRFVARFIVKLWTTIND
jgi:hypothetical protein